MPTLNDPVSLAPDRFERTVYDLIVALGADLRDFTAQRLEYLPGSDGVYEIDITARFEALGAEFVVLIECKHHKHPIKREVVQVLNDRIRSVGAQKGMIFATARFQSGAIRYAVKHGIALIWVADGSTSYLSRAEDCGLPLPSWVPERVGWMTSLREGEPVESLICSDNPGLLAGWLAHS